MIVSSQPYLKTYSFPLFSLTSLLKIALMGLVVLLPFFVTYSTPNFYMASHSSTNTTQPLLYSYQYHITITTNVSSYVYTNLYTYQSSRAIVIYQHDENGVLNFRIEWSKSDSLERVITCQITLLFTFTALGKDQLGFVTGKIDGYNIAEGTISGIVKIEQGNNINTVISKQNLILNSYDLLTTQQEMFQSMNYLSLQYSALPLNLQSDLFGLAMMVNYSSYLISNDNASILGQLIWSWIQYFPIFLSIYWAMDKVLCFLLREEIVPSRLYGDKQFKSLTPPRG